MNPSGTVFLVEDDVDVRESATWTLQRHGVAVEAFASAKEILMSLNPDALGCYVLDLRLPEMNGLELRRRLVEEGCRQPFIILSGEEDVALAVEAMRLGAADFIQKPVEPGKLLDAVRKCIEFDAVDRRGRAAQRQLERRLSTLSAREREVLDFVVQGQTSKQIGLALTISPKTVEVHRSRIVQKLGFESPVQLVLAMAERRREARP